MASLWLNIVQGYCIGHRNGYSSTQRGFLSDTQTVDVLIQYIISRNPLPDFIIFLSKKRKSRVRW